jgi:hypothetical protein
LAENITTTFPGLGQTSNPNQPLYCIFFHQKQKIGGTLKNTGKIEYKLAYLAQSLPDGLKKNSKRRRLEINTITATTPVSI